MTTQGATLGSYRIDRQLGRGGMGAVFLAYDSTLRRPVALKVMLEGTGDEESRSRLLREARNAAALNHPNICTIHEVGHADGRTFIAMEYVDGRSLRDHIDAGALPLPDVLRYGIQSADALDYAHRHGVVHRDFKAANAMVATDGRLKVVDFGLAHRGDDLMSEATTMGSLVQAGLPAGTPYAMAPEQIRGATTDARTDIWALGVLLYEMATGTKPFSAATVPELFAAILNESPRPYPTNVAMSLQQVIERCLDKEPGQRYQNAADVRLALESIQSGSVPVAATWWNYIRRRPWTATTALVVSGVVLTVTVDVANIRTRLTGTPPLTGPIKLAVLPFKNLTGDPTQEFFSDGLTEETISQLGRLHPERLGVIARTSSMPFKTRTASIGDIGRELGVGYLLEGSTRREGNRVRISVTLIRVSDQTQVWTDSFDREVASILSLQNDVALGVANGLAMQLLPAQQTRLRQARSVDPAAYEAYLQGSSHLDRLTLADLTVALRYFETALARDPTYALAHVGVYRVWATRQQLMPAMRREADQPRRAALQKAFELGETLPEVHAALAGQAVTDWDWAAADRSFRRAIDLNPSFAEARASYSQFLNQMKRPTEALAQIERAMQVDGLNPTVQTYYGLALNNANRPEEAIVQFRKVLQISPNSAVALTGLQGALLRLGRQDEALEVQRTRAASRGDAEVEGALGRGGRGGRGGSDAALRSAVEVFERRWRNREDVNEVEVALILLRLNENERALDWLERAFDTHNPNLPGINNRRPFDPLRGSVRFEALLRRMNLPS
jgi:TolB-like protein/Tfp pilus assembly protein PilF/predicted Ser/Thr protein kinase